jgi:molybdate transport system substrate-binding protein
MPTTEILVSAASSLTEAFRDIGRAFETSEKAHSAVRFNFAGSGVLLQQILAGAPVDVFASAASLEMDRLAAAGRLAADTRFDFAGNRLVLVVGPRDKDLVRDWRDLTRPGVARIAISHPATVPSGRYAQSTLEKRGLWAVLQPKLIDGANVRQTLTYVATGDADAGIVFATDARIEPRVREVAEAVSGRDHQPIAYPAAVLRDAPQAAVARRFVAFLSSPVARALLKARGFTLPPGKTPGARFA